METKIYKNFPSNTSCIRKPEHKISHSNLQLLILLLENSLFTKHSLQLRNFSVSLLQVDSVENRPSEVPIIHHTDKIYHYMTNPFYKNMPYFAQGHIYKPPYDTYFQLANQICEIRNTSHIKVYCST